MAQRQTNVIINNKCTFCMFRSELLCPAKMSVNCSVQRKRSDGNLVFLCSFFMCLIDMNKFFEKHLRPMKHVYTSCSMLTMVSLIINIYCIKRPYLSMPMLIRVLKT